MHNPEWILENETHKILREFETDREHNPGQKNWSCVNKPKPKKEKI